MKISPLNRAISSLGSMPIICENRRIILFESFMKKNNNLLLGAHMSIAGGLEKSLLRGESINNTCIQIFTASNRQWSFQTFSLDQIALFKKHYETSSIKCVFSHASYLINLGSPNKEVQDKAIRALIAELIRCDQLGLPFVVLHPGSSLNSDPRACLKRIAQNLDKAISQSDTKAIILLENMAGQGTAVAYQFEQLGFIIKHIKQHAKIGICFDTAHAFAAGYTFNTPESYKAMWDEFDKYIGIDRLKAIHINDSKKPCGSRVDRHEHIGKGEIGIEAFRMLMNDSRFDQIPKVLETPKGEDLKEDKENIETLINLLEMEIGLSKFSVATNKTLE
jgi:deoxyribonuclease IV